MRIYKKSPQTGLQQKLRWYCENYGLSLRAVRRHRAFLDRPKALLSLLLMSRNRIEDLMGLRALQDYVKRHFPAEK